MNPELRRYAWLELGRHRLLLAPLVLGALAAIPVFSAEAPARLLAWGGFWLFLGLTVAWGAMRALASVSDEVRDRTWDFQRMAAFTPAQLALAKVFGAPVFQWYVGAWCLAVLLVAGLAAGVPSLGSVLVGSIAAAVLLHGLAVALSTAGARARLGDRGRRAIGLLLVLGMVQGLPMAVLLRDEAAGHFVRWWGWRMPLEPFAAGSLVLFAGWALLAAWRAMQRELQEPARPWAWPAFAAFLALWWSGLSGPTFERPSAASGLALAAAVLVLGSYAACLLELLTPVALARMARAWRPDPARWQPRFPAWMLHGGLAVAAGAIAYAISGASESWNRLALPVALMAVRDAAVIGCFTLSSEARSPVTRAVFYIALADLLAPALATAMGWQALAWAAMPLAAAERPAVAAGAMAAHALLAFVALALCVRRARARQG